MGKGWNSEAIYTATFNSLRRTRVNGKLINKDQVKLIWEDFGEYIHAFLIDGKGVSIPKFGTFSILEQGKKGPGKSKSSDWVLLLSHEFTSGSGVRQKRGGKPRISPASQLKYVGLSEISGIPKDLCRKVVEGMIWNITFALTKDSSWLSLEIPALGNFECKNKICDFQFGEEPLFNSSESGTESGTESETEEEEEESDDLEQDDYAAQRAASPIRQANTRPKAVRRRVIPASVDRLREKCKQRGGASGIHGLARTLKIMDDSGDGQLDRDEFKYGLQDFGIRMNSAELDEMFLYFDRDKSGKISFDEFLLGLRGPMSQRRLALISLAFKQLDQTGDGVVTLEDIEIHYNADHDPDVKSGQKKPAEALRTFLDQFDTIDKDGIVTLEEFEEYYKSVSASIDKDDYFELMMRNAWHISGGKGQCANTSNRRVLVTHEDGTQTVEEIKDDLYIDKSDEKAMKANLQNRSGVRAVGKLGTTYSNKATKSQSKSLAKKPVLKNRVSKNPQKSTRSRFSNSAGDESFAIPGGDESFAIPEGDQDQPETKAEENAMSKLSNILRQKHISVDDFLLKIGANRVFGSATIAVPAFIRGLIRFDPSITQKEAEEIARTADGDQNGSIDVPELCAHIKGVCALDRIKAAIVKRGGMNGIASLSRILKQMDDTGDLCLDRRELTEGFKNFGVKLTSQDVSDVFAALDRDRNGKISLDEFLVGMRGDLNERRKKLVLLAFSRIDLTGDGVVTIEDLEQVYDCSQHPEFKAGTKTKAQILREFLDNFDEGDKDGIVTQDEFIDYYKSLSASIDKDDYFELMIRNAWHISGGSGQFENTSNRRVLVTDKNGRQSVKEVKDDLFVDTDDKAEVRKRLGVDKNAKIDYTYSNDATTKTKRTRKPVGIGRKTNRQPSRPAPLGPTAKKSAWGGNMQQQTFDDSFGGDEAVPMGMDEAQATQSRKKSSKSIPKRRVPPPALAKLKDRVIKRGGSNGIHTLSRVLKIMDDSGDKALDRDELKYGLEDYGVKCTPSEVESLFVYLDRDKSGKISFDEFLSGMRGPMSKRRLDLVHIAFQRLDRTGDGVVTVEDLEGVYDPSFHPDVKSGKLTKAQALREFLTQFDTIDQDGIVSEEEFEEYYKNVSASIDSDDYFELMMRNAWHISGGKGQCANTSNRRVLVTHEDGRQTVEEIQDDLFVDSNDEKEMKSRLRKKGINAKGALGKTYGTDQTQPPKRSAHTTSISLAWEEPETGSKKSAKGIKLSRERERKIRTGAASRLQAVARANKAKRAVALEKNKQRTTRERARLEQERVAATHRRR
mmetsp:Transcript_1443/g.2026  ORF Transcript_1443/g.2026 Transcript_1443/m.2026 type:complete len:1301 (-) Transcript_1443:1473-5375(-)